MNTVVMATKISMRRIAIRRREGVIPRCIEENERDVQSSGGEGRVWLKIISNANIRNERDTLQYHETNNRNQRYWQL